MVTSRSHPPTSDESPSIAVVKEVAAVEGIDPAELRPPLHDAIDADALDELFASSRRDVRRSGRVTFAYRGHVVRVEADGEVTVEDGGDE